MKNNQPRVEAVGRPPKVIAPVHRDADVGDVVVQAWQGFRRTAQLQRLGERRGSRLNPQRLGKFRVVGQWRPRPTGFGKFRARGQWRQPQAQQEMGHQEMGLLDQQTFNQAQSEAFTEGEAIGLHGMFNGCGLGESFVDRVFYPSLGPSSKEPPGQLTGQVEDPPVARVFELLRRSVGSPSSKGSSLARKDRRQSPICAPRSHRWRLGLRSVSPSSIQKRAGMRRDHMLNLVRCWF
ncbi:hypothetical protein TEA_013456 [Camellia sinensis var. sinensis]|uniref:Uncharacterized protein n=1 Tax=Camellia sinensis var. sinensis TaxID=542762 RepID=A0A4S4E432_CAMSN|nr:hypothetical protein TEA_013456 [Camellia sinensis var. sinensis]